DQKEHRGLRRFGAAAWRGRAAKSAWSCWPITPSLPSPCATRKPTRKHPQTRHRPALRSGTISQGGRGRGEGGGSVEPGSLASELVHLPHKAAGVADDLPWTFARKPGEITEPLPRPSAAHHLELDGDVAARGVGVRADLLVRLAGQGLQLGLGQVPVLHAHPD